MHFKILFDKRNQKIFLIWPISVLISIFLKVYASLNKEVLLINNYLVLLLVFGPALIVTMKLVFNKFLNS